MPPKDAECQIPVGSSPVKRETPAIPDLVRLPAASKPDKVYFELIPDGYRPELLQAPGTTAKEAKVVYVNDESSFWQKPRGQ